MNPDKTINSIEVYNLLGEKIYSANTFNQQIINEIDLSQFDKGIYFVNTFDEKKTYSKKVILQ